MAAKTEPVDRPSTTSWTNCPMSASQVCATDLVHARVLGGRAGERVPSGLQDSRAVDEGEGEIGVLLDHEHRDAGFGAQAPDRVVDVPRRARRETQRGLVEEQQP